MTIDFYPIQQRWRRLKPIFEQPDVIELMHEQLECYAKTRAENYGYEHKPTPFSLDLRPERWDSLDWRWDRGKPGRKPAFHRWVCMGACHWVASHNLMVISELEPDRPWQIATSDKHSSVVDLERKLLFDPNLQALDVTPEEAWKRAVEWHNSEILPVGIYMKHAAAEVAA